MQMHRSASSVPWRFTPVRWAEVVTELKDGLSPEQTSGRFQLEGDQWSGTDLQFRSCGSEG